MAMNALRNWSFEVPDIGNMLAPIRQGIADYRRADQQALENERQNALLRFQAEAATRAQEMHPLQLGQLGQQIESARASESRAAAMHPGALQAQQAQIAATRAQTAHAAAKSPYEIELLKAQAAQAGRKDETSELVGQVMRESLGMPPRGVSPVPAPAAPSQRPATVKPMSYTENPDDPMLIRTQAAGAPTPQPPEPTVKVFGREMPVSRAHALGQALMMDPARKDLGKQIVEQTSKMGMEGKTRGEIEEKLLGSVDVLARLGEIKAGFKPEFQTIENRMGYAWTALMDKLRAGQAFVTPEQRRELEQFATYRANAADNLNNYIKFITGAAMTNAEADRITKGMPNAGTGIFDGDSPSEFKAKMDAVIRRTQMSYARMNFLKNNGFSGTLEQASGRIPLDLMPKIYDERGAQIEKQIRIQNPGVDDGVLRQQTRLQLQREFGI